QSIRRAATRTTLTSSVTAAAAPKSQNVFFALRAVNAAAVRSFSVAAPRAFSRSIAFRQEQRDGFVRPNEQGRQREPEPSQNVLFVQNYSFDIKADELSEAFSKYGEVVGVSMPQRKSYCFIYYKDAESVKDAADNVDGTFWHGRRIVAKARDGSSEGRTSRGKMARPRIYDGPATSTLYIGNISFEASDADMNNLFASLNDVRDVRIAVDRATGWPRGFAHADFHSVEAATAAKDILNNTEMHGRKLSTGFAPQSRDNRSREHGGERRPRNSQKQVEERVESEHAQAEEAQKEQKPEAGQQQNNWNA
ncbi:RNA recognition domain-containing protein, partial [Colletotrichum orchidophilum]